MFDGQTDADQGLLNLRGHDIDRNLISTNVTAVAMSIAIVYVHWLILLLTQSNCYIQCKTHRILALRSLTLLTTIFIK